MNKNNQTDQSSAKRIVMVIKEIDEAIGQWVIHFIDQIEDKERSHS